MSELRYLITCNCSNKLLVMRNISMMEFFHVILSIEHRLARAVRPSTGFESLQKQFSPSSIVSTIFSMQIEYLNQQLDVRDYCSMFLLKT